MGKGVFYVADAETVIISADAVFGDWEAANPHGYADIGHPDDFSLRYAEFIGCLRARLPPSYRAVTDGRRRDRESVVIAENRLFELCLTEWETDYYLSVTPRESPWRSLAVANLPRAAQAVFIRWLLLYPLRVRTGPWTTAMYQPFAEIAAAA